MPAVVASVALLVLAYLIGSVSGSLLLGRWRGVDIRRHGSGNAGGTNAFRTQGWRFALGVVLVDIGKGALATWLALRLAPEHAAISPEALAHAAALATACGHVWPLWHGFRGGKGVGTLLGGMLVLWPGVLPWLLAAWIAVLVASGYVGLASMVAVVVLVPLAFVMEGDLVRRVFALAVAALVLFTHRANVRRLRAGNELRFERVRLWRRRA